MTNLLATILVTVLTTTNDVPRWTPQTCRDGQTEWIMYVDEASPGVPLVDWQTGETNSIVRFPTCTGGNPGDDERVRIVQTKRVTRLVFDWNGKPREIVDEDVLTETRTVLVRHETWVPSSNAPISGGTPSAGAACSVDALRLTPTTRQFLAQVTGGRE